MDKQTLTCGSCGKVLPADWLESGSGHLPCPDCGSVNLHVKLELSDKVPARPRDTLKGKVKDPSLRSKDKVRKEFFYGSQERKSIGDYIYKERELDRDDNRYRELVREEGGKIIHEVDHPLSEHTGHGSAKFNLKPQEPESDAAPDPSTKSPL
jgi:phage FluMu protein Com